MNNVFKISVWRLLDVDTDFGAVFGKLHGTPGFPTVFLSLGDAEYQTCEGWAIEARFQSFSQLNFLPWDAIMKLLSTSWRFLELTSCKNTLGKIDQTHIVDYSSEIKCTILPGWARWQTRPINSFRTSHINKPQKVDMNLLISLSVYFYLHDTIRSTWCRIHFRAVCESFFFDHFY